MEIERNRSATLATAIRHNPFIKAIEHGVGSIPTSCFYIL
jgi:hypothetical protein